MSKINKLVVLCGLLILSIFIIGIWYGHIDPESPNDDELVFVE